MSRTRSFALTATAVAGIVALSACSSGAASSDSGEELTPFTLGTNSWVGYGPWYIAQDQGYLEDEGIDLEILNYDESDYVALATTGQVDGINHSINDWLVNYDQHKFEMVLLEDVSLTADAMIGGAGVDSVADLVGKEIAFGEGGVSALVYFDALAKNGIDPDDVTTVNLEPADAGNALIAGQVDSAVTYEPYVTAALTANPDSKIIYSAGETPGLISDGLFVSPEYAAENPEVVEGLAAAWEKAVAFLEENPDEAQKIIGEATGVPEDQRATMFEGLDFYTLTDSADMMAEGGMLGTDTLPSIQSAMLAAGILETETELGDDAVNTTFITSVLDR
ncbi:ABC transporter substrate-binding protein [Cryobacterium sp.]|jgi:NitT/TauT family transport system substrate-binding protein|uniref:ABC transporter substrate-binding protein n=1 Tax=Cryobacterium sp. TaxID=1926290 RepID=UPI002638FB50|nr:ABC transporter substrate-binding protein [Cryobacterium sp.]MCU1444508.1 nrtA [Cryobacterium sp.]